MGHARPGEAAYLERLTLEAFQSGLSWLTILNKRPAFRAAFAGFDAEIVATYDDEDRARLMARRRHRAQPPQGRRSDHERPGHGGAARRRGAARVDRVVPPEVPPAPETTEQMVATSPESVALSKALKKRGFAFVGPTTMYALMEAIGIVDDHLVGCYRRGCGAVDQVGNSGRARPVQPIS